jgi:hypothetical protein
MAFKKASSITVPDILFQTLKTGSPEIDNSFSEIGGIVPSQCILMTGKPGSGKTTLALAATSKIFAVTKNPGAFISLEMSDFQLALSAKKIPGFDNMMVDTEFSLKDSLKELRKMKPSAVVLDSIQKAAGLLVKQGTSTNFNNAQKDIVDAFYKFAKETFIPVFLIGHCSKSGSYLGPSHLEHEVDSHLHVEYDQELVLRTFAFGKNRFGGTSDPQSFGITSTGVWLGSPYDFNDSDSDSDSPNAIRVLRDSLPSLNSTVEASPSLPTDSLKTLVNTTVEALRVLEAPHAKTSHIGDFSRVKTTFTYSGVAQCAPTKGELRFGKVMSTPTFNIGTIGYRKEQPYIRRNCTSRLDLFLWVVCHEWVHLYKGMQHHKLSFFARVEVLYKALRRALA